MTGSELTKIRQQLDMTRLQFARLLGYTGTDRNDIMRLRKYEKDKKQIPLYIARLAWLIGEFCDDTDGYTPVFPAWPGYEFDHTPDDPEQEVLEA